MITNVGPVPNQSESFASGITYDKVESVLDNIGSQKLVVKYWFPTSAIGKRQDFLLERMEKYKFNRNRLIIR